MEDKDEDKVITDVKIINIANGCVFCQEVGSTEISIISGEEFMKKVQLDDIDMARLKKLIDDSNEDKGDDSPTGRTTN